MQAEYFHLRQLGRIDLIIRYRITNHIITSMPTNLEAIYQDSA